MQVRDLRDDYCEFVLSNTDPSVANALRRIMLVEVTCRLCSLLHFRSPAPFNAPCPFKPFALYSAVTLSGDF